MPEPSERWTTVIGMCGSFTPGLQRGDVRVVPVRDHAAVDVGEDRAGQLDLARRDARQVHHRHDAADHGRELLQAVGGQVVRLQRLVGGAEIDGVGLDLLDAAAGADRLVVQLLAGRGLIGLGPLRVDRRGEGRARAGNAGRDSCAADRLRSPYRRSQLRISSTWFLLDGAPRSMSLPNTSLAGSLSVL